MTSHHGASRRTGKLRLVFTSAATIAVAAAGLATVTPTIAGAAVSPTLSAVQLNPTDVVGGASSVGTVRLTATAPAAGLVVALSSDDPAAATVPASVTVPAGATSASFPVATTVVPNPQSSLIIGTGGGVTAYSILTVWTPSGFSRGSVSILPGGTGNGTVTSQPAGINCSLPSGPGACSASFPVGTIVRLTAKPGASTSFVGWRGVGCADASKIVVGRGSNITCQVGLVLK